MVLITGSSVLCRCLLQWFLSVIGSRSRWGLVRSSWRLSFCVGAIAACTGSLVVHIFFLWYTVSIHTCSTSKSNFLFFFRAQFIFLSFVWICIINHSFTSVFCNAPCNCLRSKISGSSYSYGCISYRIYSVFCEFSCFSSISKIQMVE